MTRIERLRDYVGQFVGKPVTWGTDDCSAMVAAWVAQETGVAVPLPVYASRGEAGALIAAAGSLTAIWDRLAADVGLMETGLPEIGDVGTIKTARFGEVGVIFLANGVAYWREEKGVTLFPYRSFIRAWRIPELGA
ncbi:DUF6950 family protein [Pleomorphomonas oryzae]|uniref:DUF6950 family protein n=1 Tax=Pleomorphomonas oryzae TaxID=261934 RepID=UPI000423451E|nr:hypothetical protein [Pleomorphomonas oryzae]